MSRYRDIQDKVFLRAIATDALGTVMPASTAREVQRHAGAMSSL